jgi:hypothetical protein
VSKGWRGECQEYRTDQGEQGAVADDPPENEPYSPEHQEAAGEPERAKLAEPLVDAGDRWER